MKIQSSESVERSEMEGDTAKHESSANDEKSFASVEDSGDSPEPEMSDHMIPVGFDSPFGCTLVSQDSRVGENSVLSITSDAKVGQLQHGINRRLKFDNADFSFQFSSGNAGYHGFNASPYMNSTLFSPQSNQRRDARTLNNVFPRRMESGSKVREESMGGYFDELELQNNYANYSESPHSMKPLLEPVTLNPETLLQDKRKWKSETAETEKKRKKTAETSESDGCKRCNCKKTKCLKLYCDCFAAGVYCAQSCACQDCFNRTEYDDTVVEIRQQIESRNPLAFSPKIIEHINETPSSILTDVGDLTPSSGRHKRGCNCKKSKCVKKYCECYQANVGCSDNCRCEECENVHGQKQGYDLMKNLVSKQNISKKLDTAFGLMPPEGDFLQNQLYNMAPFTPAFQDSVRNASGLLSRPWFSRERYLQPPDSNLNYMSQFGHNYNREMILDHDSRMMDAASFQQGLNRGNAYAMANQFSPYDGLSPQGWMASNNSFVWRKSPGNLLTSKLADVGGFEGPMYTVVDDAQPVKVSSPNKKRVSPPPRVQSEGGPDRSEE